MNRIYKLKFDKRRNELVIVSEITAGAGKEKSTGHIADLTALSPFRKLLGTLTPVALLTGLIAGLLPAMVLAADLPTGGQIVGGQGSISTSGNQMTIHQQTQNMATNWHSFDIGKNNTVQFVQPDSSSVALNRVTGASGSQIMGTLKANGQVFILNPNGVLFGKDARVNVGGLVASTKNISTADFMKGQYTLSGNGNPGAQVVNQGSLTTAKGGYIVLAGERVSNSGTVTTPSGKTVLAAGKTVTLQLDNGGLTSVSVNGSVVNALVENRGLISATNGQVYLTAKGQDMLLNTVVNNSGTVEAKGLASRGGEIVLSGGDSGVVSQSGHLLADSQTGQGGEITLEGQNIHLAGGGLTSATGKTGGGEVYVGGGWQGKDSRIRNASKVVMDKTATVDVSATDAGNGGTAVLWSDDYTNFRGTVLAKGGAQSGHGGRVETSSHRNLQASGTVDASSPSGKGGEWLLDPTDVTIVGSGVDTGIGSATADGTDIFTPTASGAQILNSSIVNQLNAGTNVTVKTSGTDTEGQTGNITVNAGIVKTSGADAKLTLLADNNISTGDNVSIGATTGKLNLDLLAAGSLPSGEVNLGGNVNVSLNGGDLYVGPGKIDSDNQVHLSFLNGGRISAGNVLFDVAGGLDNKNSASFFSDGDMTINGPVNINSVKGAVVNVTSCGKLKISSQGNISLESGSLTRPGGALLISGREGINFEAAGIIDISDYDKGRALRSSITSANGGLTFSSGNNFNSYNINYHSKNDMSVVASGGGVFLVADHTAIVKTGGNPRDKRDRIGAVKNANLIIDEGNLSISGHDQDVTIGLPGVSIEGMNVNVSGDININGTSIKSTGIVFGESDITARNINASGVTDEGFGDEIRSVGGFGIAGFSNITVSGKAMFYGESKSQFVPENKFQGGMYSPGIFLGVISFGPSIMNLNGDFDFKAKSGGSAAVFLGNSHQTITMSNGVYSFEAESTGAEAVNLRGRLFDSDRSFDFALNNATLNINATANDAPGFYFADNGTNGTSITAYTNGLKFSGNGDVNIHVKNDSADNRTMLINQLDNKDLIGNLTVNAVNESGDAIYIGGRVNTSLLNATISGVSHGQGNGIVFATTPEVKLVSLNSNSLSGSSSTGSGIQLTGNNITLTSGTLTGTATSGKGSGVVLTGGSNYTLDGASITGTAADGSGIAVNGTLTVNNGTAVAGHATGSGNGVTVSGNLATDSGDGISITGTALSGDGIKVDGDTTLTNAVLNGSADSGVGVNIAGNLTADSATQVSGHAASGTGVSLGAVLTSASVKGSSDTGTGLQLADNAVVTEAVLNGTSISGDGVAVSGKV
ncbi:filamentous hemagglutinin N-terminal domain-containing protein, partial [Salmonella enterica]|nr:filamentous hemagglutinin N-terminal domain-containing protein [Salmonella enterica]EBP8539836.1 filamentous hemagglutinin N-terminal domain-containing protein [Salmonella enterica]EDM0874938.1 hypothetical protein [Salmonella enterica]EJC9268947.1 filamentous hemagglutinin N-terminal domain-containing protein [Salmonella enterica]